MVWNAVSLVISTLFGLVFFAVGGLGKLVTFHPMHKVLVPTFEKVAGPFFGFTASPMRITIGVSEALGGLAMLIAVWGEWGNFLHGDLLETAEALLICDIIGLITIILGAAAFHKMVDGFMGPYLIFIALLSTLLYARLQLTPLDGFSEQWKDLIYVFGGICIIGGLLAIMMSLTQGASMERLKEANKDIDRLKEQLMGGATAQE